MILRITVCIAGLVLYPLSAAAQTTPISITQGQYFNDFDLMGALGTNYTSGWNGYKVSGNGNQLNNGDFITGLTNPPLTVSNGGSGTGAVYNFGTIDDSDRALGSVASTTTVAGFGVVLVNDTGRILTGADILIEFRQEQWRSGSSNIGNERWLFEYKTGDSSLDVNDAGLGWIVQPNLDLTEIQTGTTGASSLDGNAAGNFLDISGTLAGLIWNPGDRLVLRWIDFDNLGADTGMAVDRFSFWVFVPVPEPMTWAMCGIALAGFGSFRRRKWFTV